MTYDEFIKRAKEARYTTCFQPYQYMNEMLDFAIQMAEGLKEANELNQLKHPMDSEFDEGYEMCLKDIEKHIEYLREV